MMSNATNAIHALLTKYEAALNASNTEAVLPLYAEDGVFMPQHSPSAIGLTAVRQAYDAVFKSITLDVKFRIEEIVEIAPDWAFARTNSAGTVTINALGVKNPEANQELFLFKRDTGDNWKIARYGFSTTNPPREKEPVNNLSVIEAIYKRRSIKAFDPTHEMPADDLRKLLEATIQSPTSFNLQHWRFIVLTDRALRASLVPLAMGQQQLADASVAVLLVGNPKVWEDHPEKVWVNAPKEVNDTMVSYIKPFHEGREQLQRDEVMRSIGIASMALMLAAVEMGYATSPMIGFDHEKVAAELGVPKEYAIGNFVLIGKGTKDAWPKPGFRPYEEVVHTNGW